MDGKEQVNIIFIFMPVEKFHRVDKRLMSISFRVQNGRPVKHILLSVFVFLFSKRPICSIGVLYPKAHRHLTVLGFSHCAKPLFCAIAFCLTILKKPVK